MNQRETYSHLSKVPDFALQDGGRAGSSRDGLDRRVVKERHGPLLPAAHARRDLAVVGRPVE